MKRLLILMSVFIVSFSCSNDDKVDCLAEKLEIIETFDRLIELAEGDDEQQRTLRRNKQNALDALDC
jgi:hypothetical protein